MYDYLKNSLVDKSSSDSIGSGNGGGCSIQQHLTPLAQINIGVLFLFALAILSSLSMQRKSPILKFSLQPLFAHTLTHFFTALLFAGLFFLSCLFFFHGGFRFFSFLLFALRFISFHFFSFSCLLLLKNLQHLLHLFHSSLVDLYDSAVTVLCTVQQQHCTDKYISTIACLICIKRMVNLHMTN